MSTELTYSWTTPRLGTRQSWWQGRGALLVWLLALYPLWWLLGLGALIFPIMAIPMTWSLLHRKHIEVPPMFAIWLCFFAVVVASLLTLDLNPVGTVSEPWFNRLAGVFYRLSGYACVTIITLYAINLTEQEFPRHRLIRLLSLTGFITVSGGLLGTLMGDFEFTSFVEALLPPSVANNGFVKSLVHPQASQIMDFLGYDTPRPAAPWGYTNTWGNVMAITLGWIVVAAFCIPTSTKWRWISIVALTLSIIPIIQSMNRGLWINLAVVTVIIAIRLLIIGRTWAMISILSAAAIALLVIAITPLGSIVTARLDNGHSDDGRSFSTTQALDLVKESPILGFGSTRNTQGSADSIAIGPTHDCPNCGSRTLGGNGQLWQVLFAHGITGALCYIGFFISVLWRFRHDHSAIGIVGWVVMVLSLTSMFVYNALLPPLVLTMLAYVLLWRNERDRVLEGMTR